MSDVRVALVGISGYGGSYLRYFLPEHEAYQTTAKLVGCIDTAFENCARLPAVKALGVPLFDSLEAFFAEHDADLVIISTPIHFHCEQSCLALAHGAHVLCEKPAAATVQDAHQMADAQQQSGRFLAIGYQWSFCDTILRLKQDILDGRYGRPIRFKTMVQWPRLNTYYQRSWAGMQQAGNGRWILDSPINNATAHYLHNMLFCLGDSLHTSAQLTDVTGELYRANPITNFDTGMLRAHTVDGTEILYYASHTVPEDKGPVAEYTFDRGTITYDNTGFVGASFIGTTADGQRIDYGSTDGDTIAKFRACIEAVANGSTTVPCDITAASAQTICLNGLQASQPDITTFSDSMIQQHPIGDDQLTIVQGLTETIDRCYASNQLPSEMGDLSWARAGKTVDLHNFKTYPPL